MTSIGGPGGIGGPSGPGGPEGPDGPEEPDGPAGPDGPGSAGEIAPDAAIDQTAAARGPADLEALAAEVAAGRLTAREAIDRLVDEAAGPELGPVERAELRELLTDLVANDPYLGALAGRI